MQNPFERCLEAVLTPPFYLGQLLVRKTPSTCGFVLSHRDDELLEQLQTFRCEQDAIEIAKYDDAGNYRPLKTAPNMRHGWRLNLATIEELRRALDCFYPGRLAVFAAWKSDNLQTTSLRDTLERQSGMYRVAARISDQQINDVVTHFCRSDGGCLRTILWTRDRTGAAASTKLPKEKFDPAYDQVMALTSPGSATPAKAATAAAVPLLCQEACNLLVAHCRKVVKDENP